MCNESKPGGIVSIQTRAAQGIAPLDERYTDLLKASKALRAAQKTYMTMRDLFPPDHHLREQAGKLVASCSARMDNALTAFE